MIQDALVGLAVGTLDVAFLWPFVVIACRREAGAPNVVSAVKQGRLWAGGAGALTMLVPYCVMVESLSNYAYDEKRALSSEEIRESNKNTWSGKLVKAPLTSFVIALGLQPIEKKIVMDSLFQTVHSGKGPVVDVLLYARNNGISRLMLSGLAPLWARETIYVSAVTILNPMMTNDNNPNSSMVSKCVSAFAIGFSAGIISAPLQTLNVMQKDERNIGMRMRTLVFPPQEPFSLHRLFYGAAMRSFRTGAAGVLWFLSRENISKTFQN